MSESTMFEEELCPIAAATLGEMYRADSRSLRDLISAIPPALRGKLAMYCYRRAHLSWIGLAVAASCDEFDLTEYAGYAGAVLFAKSRQEPEAVRRPPHLVNRRKITLATGQLRTHLG